MRATDGELVAMVVLSYWSTGLERVDFALYLRRNWRCRELNLELDMAKGKLGLSARAVVELAATIMQAYQE
jgi:hypothetical protein